MRAGMTHVLNANVIFKELQDTNHSVLGFVKSLDISWADDNQKMAQGTRGGVKPAVPVLHKKLSVRYCSS